jgi:hypothetical protein
MSGAEIAFYGIIDFTFDGAGTITALLPDCSRPPLAAQQPHIPYLKVAKAALLASSNPTFDPLLGNRDWGVIRLDRDLVSFGGSVTSGPASETPMQRTFVPDMRDLSGDQQPRADAPIAGRVRIDRGRLVPDLRFPLIHWEFGRKGSPPPTMGIGYANRFVLTIALGGDAPVFWIQTTNHGRMDFNLTYAPIAVAEIGCLEEPEILAPPGTYTPADEDDDFLFHYQLTRAGMNPATNLIPRLVRSTRKKAGKKTDCFAARWF